MSWDNILFVIEECVLAMLMAMAELRQVLPFWLIVQLTDFSEYLV